MEDSYTTLWSNDRIQQIRKYHQEGARLEVLFGGPHSSEPSFSRYGVKEGDYIYPLRVYKGVLCVIARMRVRRLITLQEYIEQYPQIFAHCEKGQWPMATLENYLALHPEKRYLAPTCTSEVAIGEEGTPIRLDVIVPPELLERLRFRSRKRERGLKHIENGRLKHAISLQGGVYRLAEHSAQEVEALLMSKLDPVDIGIHR
ncbi:MAG: hypothetical protein JXA78_14225 [Anaerolineales bacterium]|nr:hypothetical protein [Anaerolineales bacterium]